MPALIQGMLSLVQQPSALSPGDCPETLLLDCSQLVALQNELQRLALAAAALLISQQLLSSKGESTAAGKPDNSRCAAAQSCTACSSLHRLRLLGQTSVPSLTVRGCHAACVGRYLSAGCRAAFRHDSIGCSRQLC